jgi:hypothetical protein
MSFFSNIFSGLKDFLVGPSEEFKQFSQLNPEQQQALSQILGKIDPSQFAIQQQPTYQAGQSYLQSLLGGDISQFADPYMRQFKEQTIPGIAEQFAGLGGLSSSGFQQALGGAAAGLQERLASLRGQLQMQALPQALGYAQAPAESQLALANLGLRPSQQTVFRPGGPGILQPLAGFGATLGGAYLGNQLGLNPDLISAMGSLFNQGRRY